MHCSLVESNYARSEQREKFYVYITQSLFNSPRLAIQMRQLFALSVDVTAEILKVGQVAPTDSLNGRECKLLDRKLQVLTTCWLCMLGLLFRAQLLEAFTKEKSV